MSFHCEAECKDSFLNGFVHAVKELKAGSPSAGLGHRGGPSGQQSQPSPPSLGPASSSLKPQISASLTYAERGAESRNLHIDSGKGLMEGGSRRSDLAPPGMGTSPDLPVGWLS